MISASDPFRTVTSENRLAEEEPERRSLGEIFRASLKGHMVVFQIFVTPALFLTFLVMYVMGGVPLSVTNLAILIGGSAIAALFVAVALWFTVTQPLKKKYKL